MKYGVCFGVDHSENVEIAARFGFDYVEAGFGGLSRADENVFSAYLEALNKNNIRCEAANGFIPGEFSLTGTEPEYEGLSEYIENGMKRGVQAGLKTVVFGSGGARKLNDVTFQKGFSQLSYFLSDIASPIAEKYGVNIVIEPLRFVECNIINLVKEGVMLASSCGKDNVFGLADLYHMAQGGDSVENIKQLKGCIYHSHISNPVSIGNRNRCFPSDASEYDYKGFIDALEYAGCTRCSIEAKCIDFEQDCEAAIKVLKSL